MTALAMIGFGEVRHARKRPVSHAFAYPTYFLMLPLRSLSRTRATAANGWFINRPGLLSFFETDHGDGRTPEQGGALAWLDELLHSAGIFEATGEAWLHTYPRVLGYTFKPVSFWYCHRAADDQGGALRAVVVEVNNTFGERHCYLLDNPKYGVEQRASKVFHVSPFCQVQGHYRFRLMRTFGPGPQHTVARVDYFDGEATDPLAQVLLQTSVSGVLEPVTRSAVRRALWSYPAMTFGVMARIHWQALQLCLKKVPFFRKPALPQTFISR